MQVKEHSMQTIAQLGSLPMTKQPLPTEGTDARMQGVLLANEGIALCKTQMQNWHGMAWKIIRTTTDTRAAFLKAFKKQMAAMKEDIEAQFGTDAKIEQRPLRSATTRASELTTIANAFNGGATVEGMAEFHKVVDPEELGFLKITEYARTFSKSQAGRKPDEMLVKLHKWIKANNPDDKSMMTAEDRKVLDELLNLEHRLAAEMKKD